MKKIVSIITILCLTIATAMPAVYAYEPTAVSVTNRMQDDGTYMVTVKGTCEADSYVSIMVKEYGGTKVHAAEQCTSSSNGTFSRTFPMRSAGQYTVIVNNYTSNLRAETDFVLYSKTDMENKISEFNNAADAADMEYCIDNYGAIFGFDMRYYTESSCDYISEYMLSERGRFTLDNIASKFDESVIRAYLCDFSSNADEIIEYYDDVLGIAGGASTAYTEYKSMDSAAKAKVIETAFGNGIKDMNNAGEKFIMAVVSEIVKSGTNTAADKFITDNIDVFGFEDYSSISTVNKAKLLSGLKNSTIPGTISEFKNLYQNLLNKISSGAGNGGSSGGATGGGTGGAGAAGIIMDTSGFDVNDKPITPSMPVNTAVSFNDLGGYEWAKDAVNYLASKNIVNGRDEGIFAPGESITREEYAKILVLTYGIGSEGAQCVFSDVSSDRWSYAYIAAVYNFGAVTGYPDGTFGPENPITREEMAVMLYRVLIKQSKIDFESSVSANFTDTDAISDYAENAVLTLGSRGIISGDDAGRFNPKSSATRAEICRMVYNSLGV